MAGVMLPSFPVRNTFELNPESCKKLKAGAATTVTALLGCPGVPPPLVLP
jgi:hypothetical protein